MYRVNNLDGRGMGPGPSWLEGGAENAWNDIIGTSTPAFTTYQDVVFDYNAYWNCMNGIDPGIPQFPEETPEEHCTRTAQVTIIYYIYSPVNGLCESSFTNRFFLRLELWCCES